MREAGLPEPVVAVVMQALANHGTASPLVLRALRFVDHWLAHPDDRSVRLAWGKIERAAWSPEDLQHLFEAMPDALSDQPLQAHFGLRNAPPATEMERYRARAKEVGRLLDLLDTQSGSFQALLSDLSVTEGARELRSSIRTAFGPPVILALRNLEQALKKVDPTAKYFTSQYNAPDRQRRTYAWRVVTLASYLEKPPWAALAVLANVNCPEGKVTEETLRKINSKSTVGTKARSK